MIKKSKLRGLSVQGEFLFIKSAIIDDIEVEKDMVNLLLRFSSETRDKQGDLFLKSAWTHPEDVQFFMKKGVIDWNHLSRAGRFLKSNASVEERAAAEMIATGAILGLPKGKGIYQDGDRPTCEAKINAKNPYIASYIPLLKEGYKGLEASAAGGAFQPSGETILKHGENTWDRAVISHIAICPSNEAINQHTEIELIKSAMADHLGFKPGTPTKVAPTSVQDPAFEFIKSQPGYKVWVANQLIDRIENGIIAQKFDAVYGFLKSHGIPDQDSHDHAIHLLSLLR
ncbi:hypothetical protein [Leptospira sp. GIMC2001]|uniref:hypothetical protein n=1 Tax=Leptospira sp. GIMC2001 TaxID=1513297 RepID=UPI002349159D|nr:hypothetical protein [Leptospira sp. GIMC2001]WCL51513.1 hypothetical protein O4O04_20060 [Leptospira sp. GIMC2001]